MYDKWQRSNEKEFKEECEFPIKWNKAWLLASFHFVEGSEEHCYCYL